MKKLFILLISMVITITSLNLTAFASTPIPVDYNTLYLKENTSSNFIISNQRDSNAIKATRIRESDIYYTEQGDYVLATGTEYYQIVDKVTINLYSDNINEKLMHYEIDDVIKQDLLKSQNDAILSGNKIAYVEVYLPKKISSKSEHNFYYSYNGTNMKDAITYYYNLQVENLISGSNTPSRDDALWELALYAGGKYSAGLAFANDFVSLLDAALRATGHSGENVVANPSSYTRITVFYDTQTKYKYAQNAAGTYKLGTVSYKSNVLKSDFYHYYEVNNTGRNLSWSRNYNTIIYSPHHYDSAAAIYWALSTTTFYKDDANKIKIRDYYYTISR